MSNGGRPSVSESDIDRLVVESGVTRRRAAALLSTYGPSAFSVSRAMNPMGPGTPTETSSASISESRPSAAPIFRRPVPPAAHASTLSPDPPRAPSLRRRDSNESIRYPLPGDYPREPKQLPDDMSPNSSFPTNRYTPRQTSGTTRYPLPPAQAPPPPPHVAPTPAPAQPSHPLLPDNSLNDGVPSKMDPPLAVPSTSGGGGSSSLSESSETPPSGNTTPPRDDSKTESEPEPEPTETTEPPPPPPPGPWDYQLPCLPPLLRFLPGGATGRDHFSPRDVASAIQHGATFQELERYFYYYGEAAVRETLKTPSSSSVEGFDLMFYAVATNKPAIVRLCILFGGDAKAVHPRSGTPLIAFAILQADSIQQHTTGVVSVLLALGASARVFPSAFYTPFLQDLPLDGPHDDLLTDLAEAEKSWCRAPKVRKKLAQTMDLSQRYFLARQVRAKKPSARHVQVATGFKMQSLLGIQYFLIGQTSAAASLKTKLLAYMTLPSNRPLVLVFAGPSGHGKTELARKLGELLNLPLQVVDCTIYSKEADLFGYRPPHQRALEGTPVNNFLVNHDGKRCIMFLDEFEKTTEDVHQSLLIPFDNGEYQDRRNSQTIDCAKTIWILATNALDETIMRFYDRNKTVLNAPDPDQASEASHAVAMTTLARQLKDQFKGQFKPPLTGRISGFVPFLPFSAGEQAVIAHKYILDLAERVRREIKLVFSPDGQLVGRVYLRIARDATICSTLAAEGYDKDLGARSLIVAVKQNLEEPLVEAYLEVDDEIREDQDMMEILVNVVQGAVTINPVVGEGTVGEGALSTL